MAHHPPKALWPGPANGTRPTETMAGDHPLNPVRRQPQPVVGVMIVNHLWSHSSLFLKDNACSQYSFILQHFSLFPLVSVDSVSTGIIPSLFLASDERTDSIPGSYLSPYQTAVSHLLVFSLVHASSFFCNMDKLRIFQIFKFWLPFA